MWKNFFNNGLGLVKNLKKIFSLIFEVSPFFTLWMGFSSLISGLLPVVVLYIGKKIIDVIVIVFKEGYSSELLYTALFWVGVEFGISVVKTVLGYFDNYLYMIFRHKISNHIRLKIYMKTVSLDMSYFDNEKFYDRLTRAINESGERPIQIVRTIFSEIQVIFSLLGMVSIFSMFSHLTLIIIIICIIPNIFTEIKYSKKLYAIYRNRINDKRLEGYWGYLLTDQAAIKEVLIFGLGKYLTINIKKLMDKFLKQDRKFHKEKSIVQSIFQFVAFISYYAYYAFYVVQAITLKITLGDLNMLIAAIRRTQDQVKMFLMNIASLYESNLYINDLFSFENITPKIDQSSQKGKKLSSIEKIEFRNIFFRYPDEKKLVLKDLSFTIYKGQKVALLGKNGSGKSTIIKLLLELYSPTKGLILINDRPIQDYKIADVRKQIGVIFQDYLQYQVTVKENIAYGNIDKINDQNIVFKASKKGKSYDFIEELKDKFDTKLGKLYTDSGAELSKGQWQRIALSRAFMKEDASIYILDEPTASLDIETEYEIYKDFQKMIEDKTCLVISHRLSTIKNINRIMVLKDGIIVEDGDHDSLINNGAEYTEIYNLNKELYQVVT